LCRCLIFESTAQGDLHEYLLTHSPKSDLAMTMPRTGESERVLDFGDMSYIAIQVASGMEYLAQHHFIHRYTSVIHAVLYIDSDNAIHQGQMSSLYYL
jgi:hypothetical protein